jgi:hypothetical protein
MSRVARTPPAAVNGTATAAAPNPPAANPAPAPVPVPVDPPALDPAIILPDMVVHAPSIEDSLQVTSEGNKLEYAFAVGNRGPGHLLMIGERPDENTQVFPARQLAFKGKEAVEIGPSGQFEWHADHDHIHYRDTAQFTLQKDGLEGWSDTVTKSHFMMMDSGDVEDPVPVDPSIPEKLEEVPFTFKFKDANGETKEYEIGGHWEGLTRIGQKISAGYYDYYGIGLNEDLDLPEGEKAGWYTLTATLDPHNNMRETDETNNVTKFRFRLEKNDQGELEVKDLARVK